VIPVSSEDELWKSGKTDENTTNKEEDTLDLSSPSPEKNIGSELDLAPIAITEDETNSEDNWTAPSPILNEAGISIKAIGAIGAVTILLLMGILYILLAQQNIEVNVPNERYLEEIIYDINGSINFDSTLDIPLPIGFIDNEIIINELDIIFSGKLKTEIVPPSDTRTDGYGNDRSVLEKNITQELEDIDGTITREGENPASLENAESLTWQSQFIDPTSLEIIRSDIKSNISYSDTLTGSTWYSQSATDWVPRDSEPGLLPHGNSYIGKKLTEGTKGKMVEGGIEFDWKVTNGGKINGEQTVMFSVTSSTTTGNILGYEAQYQYKFDFYMSEISSMPLKFKMSLQSDASSITGILYAINLEYHGTASKITEGYNDVPISSFKSNTNIKTGEFSPWMDGAPAFGNGSCGLDSAFNLQTGIDKGRNEINGFNQYITNQEELDDRSSSNINERAFVIEANYTEKEEGKWNFTMAHYTEQSPTVDGWSLTYNQTSILGEEKNVDNPILSMDDVPEPLTLCSAEEVMTNFEEIEDWSVNDQTKNIDYSKVTLSLGQNLVSKQSLSSPTSILDLSSGFDFSKIISDLGQGNLNPNDYSNNIDVDTAGSYAYFLERKGIDNSANGNRYQKVAGVDAKDGLVLFNLEAINST
tara:strand:+ start:544 stop:2478 length:1935 start_codon:yes stop_codon:yes gene_type:complete